MKKVKIIQIVTNTGKNMGGVEQCAINYSKLNFLSDKVEVVTIAPTQETSYINFIEGRLHKVSFRNKFALFFKFFGVLRKERPDFLIFHSSRLLKISSLLQKFFGFKIVGINHGFNLKKFVKYADLIFCINSSQLSIVNKLSANKKSQGILIPNYTDVNVQAHSNDAKVGKIIIGTLSRIDFEYKNLDKVVQASGILKEKGCNFAFHIGGDFGEIVALKAMVNDAGLDKNFVFKGMVTDKEQFFSEIDIFCMPSKNETFGISYIEAMAHKVPVIATENDGTNDIFSQQGSAILIAQQDSDDLTAKIAENIENLAKNVDLRKEISDRAFLVAQNKYSLEAMRSDFENNFC